MKPILREHFKIELHNARTAIEAGDFETAWTALQRAHILGQTDPLSHAVVHWEMLKLAWKQRDAKEMAGQFSQTIGAAPLSLLFGQKRSLRGGRVNRDSKENRSIPEDLRKILEQASNHCGN